MPAIGVHHTDISDGSWDGPANEARLRNDESASYYRRAYAWQDPDGDAETKAAYRFIHHEVSGDGEIGAANVTACRTGIAVLNGARGGTTIPDSDKRGVYNHLAAHLRDAGVEPPEANFGQPVKTRQFRTLPLRQTPVRVDREQRIIYGASLMQEGEALGHNMLLDAKSLQQVVELGNAAPKGVKSRFTHPGLSSDGMGKYLGRLRNFRIKDDKALVDLHLSDVASKAPQGDLADYVMSMAEDEPDMFGMSAVIYYEYAWLLDDGTEVLMDERPENATNDKPFTRIEVLRAGDVVDEPAANRDGLFSAALWATNQLSEQVFGEIDSILQQTGMPAEKVFQIALAYCDARGVDVGEFRDTGIDAEQLARRVGDIVSERTNVVSKEQEQDRQTKPEGGVSQAEFDELRASLGTLQESLAAAEAEKAEAKERADTLEASLDKANERLARMENEAREKRFRALSAEWAGDPAQHVAILGALGEGSDAFNAYVEQQNAVAEQLAAGALFDTVGHDKQASGNSAEAKLEAEARRIRQENPKLSHEQAFAQAMEQNPNLYADYLREES